MPKAIPAGSAARAGGAARPDSRWSGFGVCAALAILVWVVFGQTLGHEFVNFDDDVYVYENPAVQKGLSAQGIVWAFTHPHAANWHPLASISHMLDCQIYGLNPGGHHRTSVLLHGAAAILLFLVLREMTGALWCSAFVAAVFAIHPLRVESVAWISERKDVLAGLFFMLTLGAYVRYARRPESWWRYGTVVVLFALGLLSKPMLVTLPLVLLLLDYWPLQRFARNPAGRLIREKIPLFVLSAAVCAVTVLVQRGAIRAAEEIPFTLRTGNAVASYAVYLRDLVYPANLAVFYPFPAKGVPLAQIVLALVFLSAVSAAAVWWRKSRPYFLVGWLWYLGMLVPVIGLLQVGTQARADRYTYLSQIGLYVLLTWTIAGLAASRRQWRWPIGAVAAAVLTALTLRARDQTAHWRNSEALWIHALACDSGNALALSNLGNVLLHKGQLDEAIVECRKALAIQPDLADAHNCLGYALLQKGQLDEAMAHFKSALEVKTGSPVIHNNLGLACLQAGRLSEAITNFQVALAADPGLAETHNNLGYALLRQGQTREAIAHYRQALDLKPDYAGAANNLAWLLATSPNASLRNGPQAVELARRANDVSSGSNLVILRTLAAAYAEAGRFPEAVATANQALQLAAARNDAAFVNTLRNEIQLYQSAQPFRDSTQAP